MAIKDTVTALTKRGINDETATLLATKFHTLSGISEAGVDALVEQGLSKDTAEDIIEAIGKRTTKTRTKKSTAEKKQAPTVVFEEVTEVRENTPMEKRLIEAATEQGIELPLKIYVDIAKKLEKANPKLVTNKLCSDIVATANRMFYAHQMDRNESAGIMAAHSIGEPGTQMNLRTFHFAGDSFVSVTKGLPRLIEIVDARREPSTPSMTVPLLGLAREDESIAKRIASDIEITTLSNIAEIETDITNLRLIIRPSPELLKEKNITFDDIRERLSKIRAIKGAIDNSEESLSKNKFSIVIAAEEPSFRKLQQMYDAVRNAKIKGIDGIKQAFIKKENDGDKTIYTIITDGSNLKEILKVNMVDAVHVTTNSICEIADVLGIEAARNAIVREAYETLEEAGLNVDIRHIMMVADLMTNDGTVRAIGRHGVSGKKSSVLARAAFEITSAHLLHAAIIGEVDNLEGVTENIIVGQPVTLGTGAVNLKYTPKNRGKSNE